MDPLLQFLLALAIIVVAAKGCGYLSTRLGQPAVLGELLAGLVLGPTALDMMHWPVFSDAHLSETVSHIAHLGVLFLMFIAGLEVDLEAMTKAGRPAVLAGVLGVLAPVVLGAGVALLFGFSLQVSLFVGIILAATSVSISAQTLMELGVLRSRVGVALLGGAVVDDVLVILVLSIFIAVVGGGGGAMAIIIVVAKMAAFLAIALLLGFRFIPRLAILVDRLPISEGIMALVFAVTVLFAWSAEALGGMAAITGAFLAGIAFGRTALRHRIGVSTHSLAYSWLVPIFFVSIGLEANALSIGVSGIPLALAIIAIALTSKVIGCGLGARVGGFTGGEALCLGVGMTSRGEVGLIVAAIGLNSGLIGEYVFAIVVLTVLVTTLLTPIALKLVYPMSEIAHPTEKPQPAPFQEV